MDRGIPYHIVFALTFNGEVQVAIGYKEKSQKIDAKYRVEGYYFSDWASIDEFILELKGLNLDRIYENLLRRFIPKERPQVRDLRETIAIQKEIEKQAALCESIEKQMRSERQFNVQVQLNRKLREEKAKLDELLSLNNLEETR